MTINYLGSISANDLPATFTTFFVEPVSVGFPSPANDYLESPIDLNQYLIKNGAATFLVRVSGDSMLDANIADQAILTTFTLTNSVKSIPVGLLSPTMISPIRALDERFLICFIRFSGLL